MKVYVITHLWDNGESYEDYRESQCNMLYSTLDAAKSVYWSNVSKDYEGKFILREWELDTQYQTILEESKYIQCTPETYYDDYDNDYQDDESDYDYGRYQPDPSASIEEYWQWCDQLDDYEDIDPDEYECEYEWLTHKGENLADLQQLEIDELNKTLKELMC